MFYNSLKLLLYSLEIAIQQLETMWSSCGHHVHRACVIPFWKTTRKKHTTDFSIYKMQTLILAICLTLTLLVSKMFTLLDNYRTKVKH